MLNSEQEKVIKTLVEIDNTLPEGVTLTFAVDNLAETMKRSECKRFGEIINSLIAEEYLTKHTDKVTANGIPYWLEFTQQGRKYIASECA